jgi:hypothetical protein
MYKLEKSEDGTIWSPILENCHTSIATRHGDKRQVTRDRLQDIYWEAEFHSHRFPHVRIVHP